jgi:hypothetical protein
MRRRIHRVDAGLWSSCYAADTPCCYDVPGTGSLRARITETRQVGLRPTGQLLSKDWMTAGDRRVEGNIQSFIVRIWYEEIDGEDSALVRRGSIEHVSSRKQLYFRDLEEILGFIEEPSGKRAGERSPTNRSSTSMTVSTS